MRKLKLFFACLLMAVVSIGQVWGGQVTISPAQALNNGGVSPINTACAKGDGTSNPAISSGQLRLYQAASGKTTGNTISFSSEKTITSIVFTFANSMTASNGSFSDGSYDSGSSTWTGSTKSLTLTVTGTTSGTRIYITNMVVTYDDGGTPTCAIPAFDPEDGETFTDDIDVEIAAESGTTIYYTTDGTDPTTSSDVYSSALNFTETTTLKAIATKTGSNNSAVATATYTKVEPYAGSVLEIVKGDFTTSSYDDNAGDHVKSGITFTTAKVYQSGGGIQFQKTNGLLYNKTDLGEISKIEITKVSGKNNNLVVYSGTSENPTSGAVTGSASGDMTTYTFASGKGYFAIKCNSTGASNVDPIKIYYTPATPSAVDKPTISGDAEFLSSTTVTISHDDADAIYYTTDGTVPTTSSTKYTAPFSLTNTATVKAIAVKGSGVSAPASKDFTKVEALESLAALLEATTSSETAFNVVITGWVVTGVNGTRAWIADATNEKGILLYKSGHNFVAGNKLNGVVMGTKTKLYQGYPELTTLVSTDVTVTTAEAVTPRTTTLAALVSGYNVEQGTLVKLENVTYTAGTGFSDGANTVALNTQLYGPTMVDGATYNIIGVVRYDNGPVYSIMPRSADDVEQTGEASLPEVTGLAALKAETTGASYLLNLTDAVVTLVDGNNAFIQDATAGALIYFSGHGLAAGDKLNGQYEVTTATYQGKFEITAMTAQDGATKTADAEIPVTTLTISQLAANFAANESKRIKIVGVNVTDAIANNDRNGQISDGENTFALYAGKNGIAAAENDNIDVIGYPTFFNEAHQFNVWAQADITVNEKEDPELAYNPTEVNVLLSDLASFTPAALEYATGFDGVAAITYESSDPSIATVETDGTVTLVATEEGSTTITATFTGNATYKADNASYTINVSAAPIAPVYTMSFDMTRASYDAAADAEVVWNSNVVTMTADKNDGTKVTNYLAGNYSGTTLIEETRFYAKNSISFVPQSGVTITKIEWMSTAKGYATKLAAETFVNATAVVDGTDDKLVIITPSAAGEISVTLTDAARATGVTVYYEAESEKAKLAASIAIANINMAVGDDDILLSDVAATSNPNKKAISYAVTSGSAVSIVGEGKDAAFHAVEAGTATITATIPNDLGNYTGATQTFDIIVSAGPATLESIAISGTASVLEYTEGQDFNPEGLAVTGHYSDNTDAEISEGITWAFDPSPLTAGTTSVSVTATVGTITSDAFVVNGLNVSAAPTPTTDNVVILAVYDEKYYAMSTTNANNGFTAIEIEYNGTQVTVNSAEDKAAIQWTKTTNGDNTTFQDADSKYMKSADGASMSLQVAACNWLWDATGGYYKIAETSRTFFFQNTSGGIFKNYATSNLGGNGYSDKAQVIVIAAENIVITSKVSAGLAYDPAEVELTVGGDFTPATLTYAEGFDGLAAVTYASNNESLATVATDGTVTLAEGKTGTATITATFPGNTNYLAGSASYTITVNAIPEPADVCDGADDFLDTNEKSSPTSYTDRSTPNGWSAVNAGYKLIDEKAYWMINGKTTAVGVITSPELSGGIANLKFRYANTNQENNGVSVKIEIKQGGDVVKEYTLTKPNSEVVQNTVYTELIENINVEGTFQIVITNLSPSNNTGNKDRVSIGRFCWRGYTKPQAEEIAEIGGKFIINAKGDTAVFSRGNLQYQQSTNTWRCAPNQYAWAGEAANEQMGNTAYDGWVDLFCWSLGSTNNYGATSAYLSTAYQNKSFVDWGGLFSGDWSTLSSTQWDYLLNKRSGANDKWGMAMIGDTLGMILLPEEWTAPSAVTFVAGNTPTSELWDENDIVGGDTDHRRINPDAMPANKFSHAQWAELETAGAIFLPYAGRRSGGYGNHTNRDDQEVVAEYNYTYYENYLGTYWTSTMHNAAKGQADYLYTFNSSGTNWGKGVIWSENGRYGQSVRLVHIIPRQYTVTYDANGATGVVPVDSKKYLDGEQVTLASANGLSKEGYVFAGWKFKNQNYSAGSAYTIANVLANENIVFVAQWQEPVEVVVTENKNASELPDYANVIVENGTLTIDVAKPLNDIKAKEGTTININAPMSVRNFSICATVGGAGTSGEVNMNDALTADNVYVDIRVAQDNDVAFQDQWHSFTVPCPVDAANGIYDTLNNKLIYGTNYYVMEYHSDIRANGQYGWKKFRGIMTPGRFYLITVDENTRVLRMKKTADGAVKAENSTALTYYSGSGATTDQGWCGVGNPNWFGGYVVGYTVQVLNAEGTAFEAIPQTNNQRFAACIPFFIQVGADANMAITKDDEPGLAPRRAMSKTSEIKNVAVTFGDEAYTDKLYISASEDARNEYEIGKDLVKMTMSNTPKAAQIFGKAYGNKLCMVNALLANDKAEYALTLYAPAAGEYTIAAPSIQDADIYLTKNGRVIWNLSLSECTLDLTKGDNEGYGLLLYKKAPQVATGVEDVQGDKVQSTKALIDGQLFIFLNDQMYDATGKMVK